MPQLFTRHKYSSGLKGEGVFSPSVTCQPPPKMMLKIRPSPNIYKKQAKDAWGCIFILALASQRVYVEYVAKKPTESNGAMCWQKNISDISDVHYSGG